MSPPSRSVWLLSPQTTRSPWSQRLTAPLQVYALNANEADSSTPNAIQPEAILIEADSEKTWTTLHEQVRGLQKTQGMETVPIFLATDQRDLPLRMLALQSGAMDVLTQELSTHELTLRILSRIATGRHVQRKPLLHLGSLCLDPNTLGARVGTTEIPLTPLEFGILVLLSRHPNQIFSRDEILNLIWREVAVSKRTVDAHISCIRRKLPLFEYELTTVYGAGYLMKTREFTSPEVLA